jgi:hypothetical protein
VTVNTTSINVVTTSASNAASNLSNLTFATVPALWAAGSNTASNLSNTASNLSNLALTVSNQSTSLTTTTLTATSVTASSLTLSNATGAVLLASTACNLALTAATRVQVTTPSLVPSADLSTTLGSSTARWSSLTSGAATLLNSAANPTLTLGTSANPGQASLFAVASNAVGFDAATSNDAGLKLFSPAYAGRLHLGVVTAAGGAPSALCINSNNLVGLNNTAPLYGLDLTGNLRAGTSSTSGSNVTSGLLAYYPMDGNAQDVSGNGYGLSNTGAGVSYGAGQLGTAIYYNNPVNATGFATCWSDSLVVGNTVSTGPPLTVAAWIYNSTSVATGSWQPTFLAFGGGTVATQALAVNLNVGNNLIMLLATTGTSPGYFVSGSNLLPGAWYHVAVVYDGATVTGYLNGAQYGSQVAATGALKYTGRMRVGDGFATANNATGWNGAVDDLRVYGRALSALDISALYGGPGPVAVAAPPRPACLPI